MNNPDDIRRFYDAANASVKRLEDEERICARVYEKALSALQHVRRELWSARSARARWEEKLNRHGKPEKEGKGP